MTVKRWGGDGGETEMISNGVCQPLDKEHKDMRGLRNEPCNGESFGLLHHNISETK